MKYLATIVACLSLVCIAISAHAQQDYEKQRQMLAKHIDMLDASLQGKERQRRSITQDYALLQKKIEARESLQNNISGELETIDSVIVDRDQQLSEMHIQQQLLAEQQRRLVRLDYYRRKSANKWLNLLSSASVEKMIIKWRQNEQMRNHLKEKRESLANLSQGIQDSIKALALIKENKSSLLDSEDQNLYLLQQEYEQSQETLKKLKSEEAVIRAELSRQKKESERLSNLIASMIKKEVSTPSAAPTSVTKASSFSGKKRGLPWPVQDGVVTSRFGVRSHPTLKNVKTQNLGIDMLCPSGSQVASVHGGKVLIVTRQAPYDNIVLIQHGDYVTAYYYLNSVNVSKDEEVSSGQVIGQLGAGGVNTTFHFEVWHKQKQVDPEKWLRRR